MQHIWLYGGGAPQSHYHHIVYICRKLPSRMMMLNSNWHTTLRLTVFEILAVEWRNYRFLPFVSQRPKWSSWAPFLTPHLVILKDIATKRGEDYSGTQLYHHANFPADRLHRRRHPRLHKNRQSHVSHCRVLPLGEFTVMIPEPHATSQGAVTWWNQCHDRATLQRVRILSAILKIVLRHIFCF